MSWLCAALLLLAACAPAAATPTATTQTANATSAATSTSQTTDPSTSTPLPFKLTSPSFENGGVIPKQFACTGVNISPELNWGDPPAGTQSFALIFNDPTFSPGWVHWIVYNIPASARSLPENLPAGDQLPGGGMQGANSWGNRAYGGPCPPTGNTHAYIFSLYALDTVLNTAAGADKGELLVAMEAHILAQVDLSASFMR